MMDLLWTRLFTPGEAFAHPVTRVICVILVVLLVVTPIVIYVLARSGRVGDALRQELFARYRGWLVLVPIMLAPILIGAGVTILAVCALSLLCYAEFARATGLFRWRFVSLIVVIGIFLTTFAVFDHWYGLFVALPSLMMILLAVVALLSEGPRGYLQRLATAGLAYLLFGICLAHLGYMANDAQYRPLVISVLLCVELNDVFAYITGKSFGRRKLLPGISPNKTVEGSLGALVLTVLVFVWVGHHVFKGQALDTPWHLIAMGIIVSVGGQLGDLVISGVKRDLGIKDMGAVLPGHGGMLDRFDSILFVAPALFHYIGYFQGIGLDRPGPIFTWP
ncbi:MAG: phosphatidate cytidylyltransferase [Planctomycetota bacterium]|jgi:phosphatidate cytidylyltransferase